MSTPGFAPPPAAPGVDEVTAPATAAAAQTIEVSVVVPAYNEEHRLAETLDEICGYLRRRPARWELIVVDDGSTDDTATLVEACAAEHPEIRLVRSLTNRGKGHAVRLGVLASHGGRVLITDADLATPIEELGLLQAEMDSGASAAVGSRGLGSSRIGVHQHRVRELLGRLGNRLIRVLADSGLSDTQCGFKLFDGERVRLAFSASRVDGWGFDPEVLYLFKRFGWPVAEVPVRWSHRSGSKVRPHHYLEVLVAIVRLRLVHGRTLRNAARQGSR